MEKANYSPRLTFIVLIAVVIGQVLMFNYLKSGFDKQLNACFEAINTSTIMHGALVNMLVKKNIITREELLKEASSLSTNLQATMEKMKEQQSQKKDIEEEQPDKKVK
jgi:hypothetical protein